MAYGGMTNMPMQQGSMNSSMQPDPIRQMPMSPQATMQSQMPQNFQWSPYLFAQPQPTPSAPPPPPPPPPPPVATSLFGMTPIAQAQAPAPATPPPAPFTPTISTSPDNMPLFMTPQTPPSGFRPSGMAPQFFQPVYRPRYMNYAYPGTSMGISSFGNPFLGGFGFGYRGAPRYAYAEGGIAHLLKK